MLADDNNPIGTANITARALPDSAICSVITISVRYRRQSVNLCRKKSAAYGALFPESRTRSKGRMSAPPWDPAGSASNMPYAIHSMQCWRCRCCGNTLWCDNSRHLTRLSAVSCLSMSANLDCLATPASDSSDSS